MFKKAIPVWIDKKERELNSISCLFTTFNKGENISLKITGNSFYRVMVNGRFICFGPARAAHGYSRVDSIKLDNLQENNSLFIEVAGYNAISYWSINTPAFIQAEVVDGEKAIAWTGEHFLARKYTERVRKVIRFSYQRDFIECYNFNDNPFDIYNDPLNHRNNEKVVEPVRVNGNILIDRIVNYPKYDIVGAKEVERGNFIVTDREPLKNTWLTKENMKSFTYDEFETNPYSFMQILDFHKGDIDDQIINKGQYKLFDVGYGATGFIKTSFTAREDSVVLVTFDEINLSQEQDKFEIKPDRIGNANVIEYKVRKGDFEYISFEPYTARYMNIIVKEGSIAHANVEIVSYENPDADRFYFNCEDEKVNRIIEAGRRTFKQNAVDVLTDCPSRERAGWLCDSYFSGRAEQLFTGKNLVEECMLDNYALYTKIDGIPENMIPMCYPADFENEGYIPNWALWYIIEVCDMTKRTGNMDMAIKSKKNVENIIKYFERYLNDDGFLADLDGWVFVEWSKANDEEFIKGINYPSNMIYAKALSCAGKLYGNESWINQAEKLKSNIRKYSFDGEFFEDNRIKINGKYELVGHITETCQYYAFFSGVATIEEYPELFNTLITKFGANRDDKKVYKEVYKSNAFIGNYLRLIMIQSSHKRNAIATECVNYFYEMAIRTGTLWENDNIYGSLNHGFASYAANILVDYMSGYCGRHGKELIFNKPAVSIDCEIRLPIGDELLIYKRKDNREEIVVPSGYTIKKI